MNAGMEYADSYCTNPHKWMGVNFDCDLYWTADRAALLGALSILPEYLRSEAAEAGAVIDYRDWQIPLGRRFRSLKLWFAIRCEGVESFQAMIRRHVAMTQDLARLVGSDERFEIVAPHPLNLLCLAVHSRRPRRGQCCNRPADRRRQCDRAKRCSPEPCSTVGPCCDSRSAPVRRSQRT